MERTSNVRELMVAGVYELMDELNKRLSGKSPGYYDTSSGVPFKNDVFETHNYWSDESIYGSVDTGEEFDQIQFPPQFKHFASGYEIEWYKRIGRGTKGNREISARQALKILQECFESIENVTEEEDE